MTGNGTMNLLPVQVSTSDAVFLPEVKAKSKRVGEGQLMTISKKCCPCGERGISLSSYGGTSNSLPMVAIYSEVELHFGEVCVTDMVLPLMEGPSDVKIYCRISPDEVLGAPALWKLSSGGELPLGTGVPDNSGVLKIPNVNSETAQNYTCHIGDLTAFVKVDINSTYMYLLTLVVLYSLTRCAYRRGFLCIKN